MLEGPPADLALAGTMHWLGYYLIDQSPFQGTPELITKFSGMARQAFQGSFLESARALIAGTFRYTFEDIDSWDQETFFLRLAGAEFLVGKHLDPSEKKSSSSSPDSPAEDPMERMIREQKQAKQTKAQFLRKKVEGRRLPNSR
jgi:hypothetical protein